MADTQKKQRHVTVAIKHMVAQREKAIAIRDAAAADKIAFRSRIVVGGAEHLAGAGARSQHHRQSGGQFADRPHRPGGGMADAEAGDHHPRRWTLEERVEEGRRGRERQGCQRHIGRCTAPSQGRRPLGRTKDDPDPILGDPA